MRHDSLAVEYRGYIIGVYQGRYGFKPCYYDKVEHRWIEVNVYTDGTHEDLIRLAKECIDFRYKQDVRELELGRKLTRDDLITLIKEEKENAS